MTTTTCTQEQDWYDARARARMGAACEICRQRPATSFARLQADGPLLCLCASCVLNMQPLVVPMDAECRLEAEGVLV
jgi:hypothetical protein